MSLLTLYKLTLHLLPSRLRRKHGANMVLLFTRDVDRARTHGLARGLLVGAAAIADVVTRAIYEQFRPTYGVASVVAAANRPEEDVHMYGPATPPPHTRALLARLTSSFVIALVVLTTVMLANYAIRQVPALIARGADGGTLVRAMLLSVPFTAAMTIPMAVLVSVLHVFTRMGADGVLTGARHGRHGVRRLVMPVIVASAVVAVLALALTTQVLPHANAQLSAVLRGGEAVRSDRTMTVTELRTAAREAARDAATDVARIALASDKPALLSQKSERYVAVASIEVEIHKKFALPAACVVLAIAAMAIAWSIPRGGTWLVLGASLVLFTAFYVMLIAGESLAERLVVPPSVAVWGANGVVMLLALLLAWLAALRRSSARVRVAQA